QNVMFRAAWQGGFLDMAGDWDGRGGNPVRVLGQRFYGQAAAPLHVGAPDADAQRVFKGYELKDKIPTFIYTVGDVEVRERITATPDGVGIVREFEFFPPNKPVFFTATDEPGVALTASLGEFKPGQVQKSFKSPDKAACARNGEVFPRNESGDWKRFATGLRDGLGLWPGDSKGQTFVTQRTELTKLTDSTGSGEADKFEAVNSSWGYNGNYHSFAFGL